MRTIVAVLRELPSTGLCIGCLVSETGLRMSAVHTELEGLGAAITVHEAECQGCQETGPVFAMAA